MPSPSLSRAALLVLMGGCLAAAPGRAADTPRNKLAEVEAPKERRLWSPTLDEKNRRRMLTRLDRNQVTYHLSEPGRWSTMREYVDFESSARYAARRILRTQLETLRPDVLDVWKEAAVGLRSRTHHEGEVEDPSGPIDIDVGLRSGRPFLGTNLAKARLTFEWDVRRDRGKLSATRKFGEVGTRLELRTGYEDDEEIRVSISVPVSW